MPLSTLMLLDELVAKVGVIYLDHVGATYYYNGATYNVTMGDYGTRLDGDSPANLDLVFRTLARVKSWDLTVKWGTQVVTTDEDGNETTGAVSGSNTSTVTLVSGLLSNGGGGQSSGEYTEDMAVNSISSSSLYCDQFGRCAPNSVGFYGTVASSGTNTTTMSLNLGLFRNGAKTDADDYLFLAFFLSGTIATTAYVANDCSVAFETTGNKFYYPDGNSLVPNLQKNFPGALTFLNGKIWNLQGGGSYAPNPNYKDTATSPKVTPGEEGSYAALISAEIKAHDSFEWGGMYDPSTGLRV